MTVALAAAEPGLISGLDDLLDRAASTRRAGERPHGLESEPRLLPRIREAAAAGLFERRPLSWTLVTDRWFLKIPRKPNGTDSILAEATREDIRERAGVQANRIRMLSRVFPSVLPIACHVEPLACLVSPKLAGPDLIEEILGSTRGEDVQPALEEGIGTYGRLHARGGPDEIGASLPTVSISESATRLGYEESELRLMILGVHIRNQKRERPGPGEPLYIIDPHKCVWAPPEYAVADYIMAVLMANWGDRRRPVIFDRFALDGLVRAYERASGRRVEMEMVSRCLDAIFALFERQIGKRIGRMRRAARPVARLYRRLYLGQIVRWRRRNRL